MLIPPENFILKKPDSKALKIYENTDLQDEVIYEKESDFHDIKIVQNNVGKFLMFDKTYQAGFIDTPVYKGNLPYINYFILPYLLNQNIKNILLIGMGTGKIINDYEKLLPNLKNIDIVDIDPDVSDMATGYFGFNKSKKTNIHIQDGRVFLRKTKRKYDVIIIDIAGNEGLPYRYMTKEFLAEVKQKLSKKGILVSNMFSSPDFENKKNFFLKSLIKTYREAFTNVGILKCDYSDSLFYKAFFNYDKRIIEITNAIFIASDCFSIDEIETKSVLFENNVEKAGIKNISAYAKDLNKDQIDVKSVKALKDEYLYDTDFYVENFNNYVNLEK